MSFASPVFLWYFMPAVLLALWAAPKRARNLVVASASLLFYAWGAGEFVLLLLACIAVNFLVGRALDSERFARDERARKGLLAAAVTFDVGILAIWKYGTFGLEQSSRVAHWLGVDVGPVAKIALPIGISFFTFHHISYVVDIYRRVRPAQRSPLQFITYIAMFPQLIAGPIVRYHEIADQLPPDRPRNRMDDFAAGFPRFALGLAKKVIVADTIAPVADAVFRTHASAVTTPVAWLGAVAFTLQIYFDFSGYSDMAIGLGQMLGFRLPENFDRPYSAVSITDFWRRWHMSLSRWFRDYLYIPLGGNRGSSLETYRNLFIVFTLTGFWHGAAWTFVAWGLYHGCMLAFERASGLRALADDAWVVPRRALTLLLVIVGWVPFRAESLHQAATLVERMFVPHFSGSVPASVTIALNSQARVTLALATLVALLPRGFVLGRFLDAGRTRRARGARVVVATAFAPYAAILVAAGTFSPFLYFRF
jgi:alginate O-acetyltransferase complex protein AlgI